MGAVSAAAAAPVAARPRAARGPDRMAQCRVGRHCVAMCAGIALGAGAFGGATSRPASLYQRTMDVAGEYRCPVCAGESVAASDAPEAVEIKGLGATVAGRGAQPGGRSAPTW